jgi:hypothetical protein
MNNIFVLYECQVNVGTYFDMSFQLIIFAQQVTFVVCYRFVQLFELFKLRLEILETSRNQYISIFIV